MRTMGSVPFVGPASCRPLITTICLLCLLIASGCQATRQTQTHVAWKTNGSAYVEEDVNKGTLKAGMKIEFHN